MNRFLIFFKQVHSEFRLPELESVLQCLGIVAEFNRASYRLDNPFFIISLPSIAAAKAVAGRSILIRSIYLLCAHGNTHQEARAELQLTGRDLIQQRSPISQGTRWKFTSHVFRKSKNTPNIVPIYASVLEDMIRGAAVDLRNPEVTLAVLEDFSWSSCSNSAEVSGPPDRDPDLARVFMGVWLADGDSGNAINKFDLKKRDYLGTTSMDARLSLVMGNQALARSGSLIYDPFVGTGSFLCTCSHFGAYTIGSDLDGRQLRGLTKHRNRGVGIMSNIKQYGLDHLFLDTVICDHSRHPFRRMECFDAIVTDPPYGVRAGAKKIATDPTRDPVATTLFKFPKTEAYDMEDVVIDLVNFSAQYLVVGGRLVFWLPTVTEEFEVQDLPSHPCLKLVANSSQSFGNWERRLITMEKVKTPEPMDELVGANERSPAHAKFRMRYFQSFAPLALEDTCSTGR